MNSVNIYKYTNTIDIMINHVNDFITINFITHIKSIMCNIEISIISIILNMYLTTR